MRLFAVSMFFVIAGFKAGAQQRDLDFFIDQALRNSPLLQDLNNQTLANRVDSLRLRAGLRPRIEGNAAAIFAPSFKGWGYDYALSNGGSLSALISASRPLYRPERIAAQEQSIALQTEVTKNTARTSAQDIRRGVGEQYLTTLADRQQWDFNREVLDLLHREEGILKKLTETSVYRQTDYLTFLTTIQQQELLVKQLENQWRNDLAALQYLCGMSDTAAINLADPALTLLPPARPAESAFFEPYRLDSLRIRNDDALIDFSYRPQLNAVADAGFNSAFTSRGYRNFGVSAGLLLTVPIYDGHQRELLHQKNTIAENTRLAYARNFDRQYRQQIALLYQQLDQTEALIAQTEGQIKYSRALMDANGKLLRTGDARVADYILALNNYLNVQNLATRERINRLQIINQLNYWSLK